MGSPQEAFLEPRACFAQAQRLPEPTQDRRCPPFKYIPHLGTHHLYIHWNSHKLIRTHPLFPRPSLLRRPARPTHNPSFVLHSQKLQGRNRQKQIYEAQIQAEQRSWGDSVYSWGEVTGGGSRKPSPVALRTPEGGIALGADWATNSQAPPPMVQEDTCIAQVGWECWGRDVPILGGETREKLKQPDHLWDNIAGEEVAKFRILLGRNAGLLLDSGWGGVSCVTILPAWRGWSLVLCPSHSNPSNSFLAGPVLFAP